MPESATGPDGLNPDVLRTTLARARAVRLEPDGACRGPAASAHVHSNAPRTVVDPPGADPQVGPQHPEPDVPPRVPGADVPPSAPGPLAPEAPSVPDEDMSAQGGLVRT